MADDTQIPAGEEEPLYEIAGRPVRRVPKDSDGNPVRDYDVVVVRVPAMPAVVKIDREHPLMGGDPWVLSDAGNDEAGGSEDLATDELT